MSNTPEGDYFSAHGADAGPGGAVTGLTPKQPYVLVLSAKPDGTDPLQVTHERLYLIGAG